MRCPTSSRSGWQTSCPSGRAGGNGPCASPRGTRLSIPKRAPPRPLNTRPLTILSMIYRLWAGIRLEEAIRWQEAWGNRCAFAFRAERLGWRHSDPGLLEPCGLKGWAMVGMSVNYGKCLDLIPTAIA